MTFFPLITHVPEGVAATDGASLAIYAFPSHDMVKDAGADKELGENAETHCGEVSEVMIKTEIV